MSFFLALSPKRVQKASFLHLPQALELGQPGLNLYISCKKLTGDTNAASPRVQLETHCYKEHQQPENCALILYLSYSP